MLKSKFKILAILLILTPVFLAFKQVLFGNLQTFGDAPFFYSDVITSLFSEPRVWTGRGINFGGVNQMLWISPIMIVYGALAHFFSLNNSTVIRIVFYLPAIISSLVGPYLLTRYLKFSNVTSFFSVLVYSLNTYFILLIDGGQVGIALAYGIFPIILLFIKKLIDNPSVVSFIFAYIFGMVLCVIDPRIYIILILLLCLWTILEKKSLKTLFILQIPILLSNLYWLYPMIKMGTTSIGSSVLDLQATSLLNSLLLYAPHWPNNTFGKIDSPSFYFSLVPFLLFGSYLFGSRHKDLKIIGILFLFFSFLAKGSTPPFGGLYDFLVTKVPLGSAFRDSSKFFIPLILLGGILIGETVENLKNLKFLRFNFFIKVFSFVFILFLIWPAIFGKLNFNLSNREANDDFNKIYLNLKQDQNIYKTLWFPEKNPLSFEANEKPALDARELVKINSIAIINASEDPFNFLNNKDFPFILAKLGVRYLFLNGDARNLSPDKNEIKDWKTITKLVTENPNLKKLNWGTSFPVFEIANYLPKFFKVNSLVGVIGPNLNSEVPSVYFEDGKFDPRLLEGKDPSSVKLFFNGKSDLDLTMSFLQKFFVDTGDAYKNEWAYYPHTSYLKVKYELLIRDIKYDDFDYNKGLSFSTLNGEKIKFRFDVEKDLEYVLAVRKMNGQNKFVWEIINEHITTKNGNFEYELINNMDFSAVNVAALIPSSDFEEAQKLTQIFIKHFGTIKNNTSKNYNWDNVEILDEGTSKYKLLPNETGFWVILNESYNPHWVLRKGVEYFKSIPINSEVNGFYAEPGRNDLHIEFDGQKYFRWGLYYSLVSILGTLVILLFKYAKDN